MLGSQSRIYGQVVHYTVYILKYSFIYFVCFYSHVLFCFSNWFGLFGLVWFLIMCTTLEENSVEIHCQNNC